MGSSTRADLLPVYAFRGFLVWLGVPSIAWGLFLGLCSGDLGRGRRRQASVSSILD